jgi:hypothetical protein
MSVLASMLLALSLTPGTAAGYKFVTPLCPGLVTGNGLVTESSGKYALRYTDAMFLREAFAERAWVYGGSPYYEDKAAHSFSNAVAEASFLNGAYSTVAAAGASVNGEKAYLASTNGLATSPHQCSWDDFGTVRGICAGTPDLYTASFPIGLDGVMSHGKPLLIDTMRTLYADLTNVCVMVISSDSFPRTTAGVPLNTTTTYSYSSYANSYSSSTGFHYENPAPPDPIISTNTTGYASIYYGIVVTAEKTAYIGTDVLTPGTDPVEADRGTGERLDVTLSLHGGSAGVPCYVPVPTNLSGRVTSATAYLFGWYHHVVEINGDEETEGEGAFAFPVAATVPSATVDEDGKLMVWINANVSPGLLKSAAFAAYNEQDLMPSQVLNAVDEPDYPAAGDAADGFAVNSNVRVESLSVQIEGTAVVLTLQFDSRVEQ